MNAMVTLQCLQSYIKKQIRNKWTSNEKIDKSMSNKNNTQIWTNNESYKKTCKFEILNL
jgi:hypothetical protein